MVQNRQKVKVNPFTFWRNLANFEIFKKGSKKPIYALKRVSNFIGRIIFGKIDFEKRSKNGQISPKSKGINYLPGSLGDTKAHPTYNI